MCRWIAYTGSPLLIEDLLYVPENSLIVQSLHAQLGRGADQRRRVRRRLVRRPGRARRRTGASSRPGTTGTCGSWPRTITVAARARARAGLHRDAGAADQLPSRSGTAGGCGCTTGRIAGFHGLEAGPGAGRGPGAVPRHRGVDRLGAVLLPGAHVRAAGRSARRGRPGRRTDRGRRPAARRAVPGADDRGDDGRRDAVGVPVLQRGTVPRRSSTAPTSPRCAQQYPDNPRAAAGCSDDARLVVSEPLGGLRGAWREVPEGTCVVVRNGQEEQHPFTPTVLSSGRLTQAPGEAAREHPVAGGGEAPVGAGRQRDPDGGCRGGVLPAARRTVAPPPSRPNCSVRSPPPASGSRPSSPAARSRRRRGSARR